MNSLLNLSKLSCSMSMFSLNLGTFDSWIQDRCDIVYQVLVHSIVILIEEIQAAVNHISYHLVVFGILVLLSASKL
jgi:hypothetical protein